MTVSAQQAELYHGAGQPPALQLAGTVIGKVLEPLDGLLDGSLVELCPGLHHRPERWWSDGAPVNAGGEAVQLLASRAEACFDRCGRKRSEIAQRSQAEHLESERQPGVYIRKDADGQIGEKGSLLSRLDNGDSLAAHGKRGKLGGNAIRCDPDPGGDTGSLANSGKNHASGSERASPEPLASSEVASGPSHLHRLDQRCVLSQRGEDLLPDHFVRGEIGL
jgi:hypothetical protein